MDFASDCFDLDIPETVSESVRSQRFAPLAPPACYSLPASSLHHEHKLSRVRSPMAPITESTREQPPLSGEELLRKSGFESVVKVGHDGHGDVYNAEEPSRTEPVTVRVLTHPDTFASRAELDAADIVLAGLVHPSIVPVFGLIEESNRPVGVYGGFVTGPRLAERLGRPERPDLREASRLVLALAEALQFGHARGVVHGEVTPGNVLLGDDGTPRLIDFGLTLLEYGPFPPAEPAYAAPELLGGSTAPSVWTDVYSLGVILYQLLTGVLPYPDNAANPLPAPTRGVPRPPRELNHEVPGELEAICLKAMAVDPAARYASARRLVNDLRAFLGIKKQGLLRRVADALKPRKRSSPPAPDPAAVPPPPREDRREGFWR